MQQYMPYMQDDVLKKYVDEMSADVRERYYIDPAKYASYNVKRGLRNMDGTGVMAGVTRIGSVQGYMMLDGEPIPMPGRLYYRGIEISQIVKYHAEHKTFGFEEVAYLLLLGKLPTEAQLRSYDAVQSAARRLPDGFAEDMILKAPSRSVMNKLSRAVLALYTYDPNPDETSVENMVRQSIELVGRVPIIAAYAYAVKRHYYDGQSLIFHVPQEDLSLAENFLHIMRPDTAFTEDEALLLDILLMLHAEHGGGNNSAFACRVLSSTGTDTYGAISAAINSLKGPLHGGANQKVMEMLENVKQNVPDPGNESALRDYLSKMADGEVYDGAGKIYGLGHAVYTESDPRAVLLKEYARKMADQKGFGDDFRLMEEIERIGKEVLTEKLQGKKTLCANVDMYSGLVYRMLDIPQELMTPMFAIARMAGWCGHRMEEILTGGRIIRPAYRAVMPHTDYVPIEDRV